LCDNSPRDRSTPPNWWNISLYTFITEDFTLEGWVWEFMRRDRLREVLGDRPVDAMNPNPDLEIIEDPFYWNYYKPANHIYWDTVEKAPYFLPPAVNIPERWPPGFSGQQYRLEDDELRNYIKINIDINRRDKVLLKDFKVILSLLRQDNPEPSHINPRTTNWIDQHILQVWDLRQFNIKWRRIAELVGFNVTGYDNSSLIQRARNAITTARNYIDNRKWIRLARYIEL